MGVVGLAMGFLYLEDYNLGPSATDIDRSTLNGQPHETELIWALLIQYTCTGHRVEATSLPASSTESTFDFAARRAGTASRRSTDDQIPKHTDKYAGVASPPSTSSGPASQ